MPGRMPEGESWGQWPTRLSAECGPLAAAAWAAIRRRMGPRDEPAVVGLSDLATDLARCPRTVKSVLRRLAATGWLEVCRTGRAHLLSAVVAPSERAQKGEMLPPEHIERGKKLPIRGAISCPSEGQEVAHQMGKKLPLAPPPPNNPPVTATGETGRGGERETTAPPPADARATETATAGRREDGVEALAREFRRRQVTPEPLEAVLAVLAEDVALKRYRLEDLRTVVYGFAAFDARAYRLRDRVRDMAAHVRRGQFLERLAAIQAGGMVLAWRRSAPSTRARVESVDPQAGRLVLCEWSADGRGDRRVIERLQDLEPWAFAPEGPTLFPLGDGPAPAGPAPPQPAVSLPEDPAARAAAERLMTAVGRERFSVWIAHSVAWWVDDGGAVSIEPNNRFLCDYLRSHFGPAMAAAGIAVRGPAPSKEPFP